MTYKTSKPFVYSDMRSCWGDCCVSQVTGMKKILQESEGGTSCIVQEFYKNTHGIGCSIRGYNIYFKEPIVISNSSQRLGETGEDFVSRMREELRQCARETSITTFKHKYLIRLYGSIPALYRWGLRDGSR